MEAALQASWLRVWPLIKHQASQNNVISISQTAPAARLASPYYGAARPQLPAAVGGEQPHLTGLVAGDYGFDPLGFSRAEGGGLDQEKFRRLHEAELLHARWVGGVAG